MDTLPDPVLQSRGVRLRPIGIGDYEPLRFAEADASLLLRWRHEGRTPPLDGARGGILADALCSFIVEDSTTEEAVGIVIVHGASFAHNRASMSVACFDRHDRVKSTKTMIGQVIAINYVFTTWDLNKLSATVAEFNFDQFTGEVGDAITEEGRLREHLRLNGRYWDLILVAIFRRDWAAKSAEIARTFELPEVL